MANASTSKQMDSGWVAGLVAYLFVSTLLAGGVVYTLWLLQFPAPLPGALQTAPMADWYFLWFHVGAINQDVQMFLLAICMGAFGSSVYAMKSIADYKGDGKLTQSWLTFYLVQPPEGAGVAVLLYLALRGGFMAGTSGGGSTNLFSICAMSALAGAFSDTAFAKLSEVFDALFKPKDDRGGRLSGGLEIDTESPLPDGTHGTAYRKDIQAKNGVAPLTWTVTPALPAGLTLDGATGTIAGTPTAVSPKSDYTFKVTDSSTPAASVSKVLSLTVN